METWFLTNDGRAVIVDPTAGHGSTHDEWRELVARTRVRMPLDQLNAPWGQMARRDFLNWCEEHLPEERKPRLFRSKTEAVEWSKNSNIFDETSEPSKKIENSVSSDTAQEGA